MSGGKGGSQTTTMEIPQYLEDPLKRNIAKAEELAKIGYTPYYGPDVAAMTPMQLSAGNNINAAASAFGLSAPTSAAAGMPQAQNFGGMAAYSSAPLYEQSLGQLEQRMPGQYAALRAPFIDPVTGAQPLAPFGMAAEGEAAPLLAVNRIGEDRGAAVADNWSDRYGGDSDRYAGMSDYDRAYNEQMDRLTGSRGGIQVEARDSAGGMGGGK